MNPVRALENHGQAVWLDFLARGFVAKGDLKKLIDSDGVKGVTSNPSIFEKAIGSSDEYDAPIGQALKKGDRPVAELFEHLAVEDIQHAADVLRPVYDELKGHDGFVSLEVSPYLALDTKGTIVEAERLWKEVDRKNLMVKVPATAQGLPAIQQLIGEGISINITLLFSQKVYVQVAEAYLAGLEKYVAKGGDPSHVASVASFFVSRIDSAVDKQLDDKIAKANDPSEKERLAALKGKVAIANAKLAYQEYKRLFSGARWDKLAAKGAKPQRLLWASTGTKNKDYSDVLYVEELIGPNTVNTVPPGTLDAFRDHGQPRDSLEENVEDARHVLAELEKSGISLDAITAELVKDGVKQFADAADKLYGAVAHKRATVLGEGIDRQALALGNELGKAVEKSTEDWRASAKIRHLWQHDKSVWTGDDENKWLGWLSSPAAADVADVLALDGDPDGAAATESLSELEDELPAMLERSGLRGVRTGITGDTTIASELSEDTTTAFERVAPAAIVVLLLLLWLLLKSWAAPLYLVGSSLLVVAAALGLTVYVFQGLLGYNEIAFFVPVATAILMLALGADYNVFLISRIWSEAERRELKGAIRIAGSRASSAIGVAGLILALSFGAVWLIPIAAFRELAFAMFVGLMLDTWLARPLLVPALVSLFGSGPEPSSRADPAPEAAPTPPADKGNPSITR